MPPVPVFPTEKPKEAMLIFAFMLELPLNMPEPEEGAGADILNDSIITNPMQVDLGKYVLLLIFKFTCEAKCIFLSILHDTFKILSAPGCLHSISRCSVCQCSLPF